MGLSNSVSSKFRSCHGNEDCASVLLSMNGRRRSNEDTGCIRLASSPSELSFIGVFDGHNGIAAAMHASSRFHQLLPLKQTSTKSMITTSDIVNACRQLDEEIMELTPTAGTTAVFAIFRALPKQPDIHEVVVGNIGDARALVIDTDTGAVEMLSVDHKPCLPNEASRIISAGGIVEGHSQLRVNGNLSVSRALGDEAYKVPRCFPSEMKQVTAEPHIVHVMLRKSQALLLSCDGIFEEMSNEKVAEVVMDGLVKGSGNSNCDLSAIVSSLFNAALESGSQDNMTSILTLFRNGTTFNRTFDEYLFDQPSRAVFCDRDFKTAYLSDMKNHGVPPEKAEEIVAFLSATEGEIGGEGGWLRRLDPVGILGSHRIERMPSFLSLSYDESDDACENQSCNRLVDNVSFLDACIHGDLETVQKYLENFIRNKSEEKPVVVPVEGDKKTPLHVATLYSHVNIVDALIGSDLIGIDSMDTMFWTPLQYAVHIGVPEIVRSIVSKGKANVSPVRYGAIPHSWVGGESSPALRSQMGHRNSCISSSDDVSTANDLLQGSPLIHAAILALRHANISPGQQYNRWLDVFEILVSEGSSAFLTDCSGNTIFHVLAGWVMLPPKRDVGREESFSGSEGTGMSIDVETEVEVIDISTLSLRMIMCILETPVSSGLWLFPDKRVPICDQFTPSTALSLLLSIRNNAGRTALHVACASRHPEIVALLIAKGADVNAPSEDLSTPLHLVHRDDASFTSQSSYLTESSIGSEGVKTPSALVIESIVELILHSGGNVDAQDVNGRTPLHTSAGSWVNLLRPRKIFPNVSLVDSNGETALHCSVTLQPNEHVISELLTLGYLLNVPNNLGETPLHIMAVRPLKDIAGIVKLAKDGTVALESRNARGLTPFHVAIFEWRSCHNRLQNIKQLVACGADVNAIVDTCSGDTALHLAISEERLDMVELLLKLGIRDDIPNSSGIRAKNMSLSDGKSLDNLREVFDKKQKNTL